jgi:hypothetical protein
VAPETFIAEIVVPLNVAPDTVDAIRFGTIESESMPPAKTLRGSFNKNKKRVRLKILCDLFLKMFFFTDSIETPNLTSFNFNLQLS